MSVNACTLNTQTSCMFTHRKFFAKYNMYLNFGCTKYLSLYLGNFDMFGEYKLLLSYHVFYSAYLDVNKESSLQKLLRVSSLCKICSCYAVVFQRHSFKNTVDCHNYLMHKHTCDCIMIMYSFHINIHYCMDILPQ